MDNQSIKENIRSKRKEVGISQETMAERLCIANSTYWEIESGSTVLLNQSIERIAGILGCSVAELVCGNNVNETGGLLQDEQEDYRTREMDRKAEFERRIKSIEEEKDKTIAEMAREIKTKNEMIDLLKRNLEDKEVIIRMKDKELSNLRNEAETN